MIAELPSGYPTRSNPETVFVEAGAPKALPLSRMLCMSLGTILLIILVVVLLGAFNGAGRPLLWHWYYGGGGLGLPQRKEREPPSHWGLLSFFAPRDMASPARASIIRHGYF